MTLDLLVGILFVIPTVPLAIYVLMDMWHAHAQQKNPDTEHGLVIATSFLLIAVILVFVSIAHVTGDISLDHISTLAIRGLLFATLVYIVLRHPRR